MKANALAKDFAKVSLFSGFSLLVPSGLTTKAGYDTTGQRWWCAVLLKFAIAHLLFMNGREAAAVHRDQQPSQQRCFEPLHTFGRQISDKAQSGKHHRRRTERCHPRDWDLPFPITFPPCILPHTFPRAPRTRGAGKGQGVGARPPPSASAAGRPLLGPHLEAHLGGRGPSPRAHLAAAGGGPTPGREERRSAQPRRRPGRAEPARSGGEREAARWGGRPAAWPRSGCCCCWRWGTPGLTGRSRRTATGGWSPLLDALPLLVALPPAAGSCY